MDDAVMDQSAPNGVTGGVATTSGSSSMSQKELRELRRKRIMERGRDRLAYITGEVKTLPPTAAGSNPGEMGLKTLANPGELPVSDFTSAGVQLGFQFVSCGNAVRTLISRYVFCFLYFSFHFINCDCHHGIHFGNRSLWRDAINTCRPICCCIIKVGFD